MFPDTRRDDGTPRTEAQPERVRAVDDGDDEILRKGWGDVKCLADELRA